MAYNNKNKLFIIYFVQEYYNRMNKVGIPNTVIVKKMSRLYPIGMSTFYNYLAINAKKEIKEHNLDINLIKKFTDDAIKILSEH